MVAPTNLVLPYHKEYWEALSNKTEHGLDKHSVCKTQSQLLAIILRHLKYFKQAERTENCNSFKAFQACIANIGHPKNLKYANYCRNRFCATCQWLRSRRAWAEAMSITEHILRRDPTLRYIFLTLTVPNLPLSELGGGTTAMMAAWKRLVQRKRVSDIILGYHRSLEVSYNPKRNDYHPHFHSLFVVPERYFAGKYYINRAEWLSLWQQSMRDESITQVDVRAVKPKEDLMDSEKGRELLASLENLSEQEKEEKLRVYKLAGAVSECTKYGIKEWALSKTGKDGKRKGALLSVKEERIVRRAIMNAELDFGLPGHIWIRENVEESAKVFEQLRSALSHRRLTQPGGIIAEVKRELGIKDEEGESGEEGEPPEEERKICKICGCDMGLRIAHWESFYDRYTGEKSHRGKYLVYRAIPIPTDFEIPY